VKIILNKDVENVGKAGQMKEVADGYARNYLIPKGLAVAATNKAMKGFEAQQAVEKRRQVKAEEANRALAEQVANTELRFKVRVGEQHRMYGSITNADIAEALTDKLGRQIDKHLVEMEEPLKHLGTFKVPVHIGPNLSPKVTVTLEREE
jgi:large subunit ribosomal protein L9